MGFENIEGIPFDLMHYKLVAAVGFENIKNMPFDLMHYKLVAAMGFENIKNMPFDLMHYKLVTAVRFENIEGVLEWFAINCKMTVHFIVTIKMYSWHLPEI